MLPDTADLKAFNKTAKRALRALKAAEKAPLSAARKKQLGADIAKIVKLTARMTRAMEGN